MKKRTGAPTGSNNGGGRKKSERELIRRNFLVFKDTPITSQQVREAIDLWVNVSQTLSLPETFLDHSAISEAFPGTTSTAFVTVKTGETKEFTITHNVNDNRYLCWAENKETGLKSYVEAASQIDYEPSLNLESLDLEPDPDKFKIVDEGYDGYTVIEVVTRM